MKNPSDLHQVIIIGGGAGGLELASRLGRKLGKKKKAAITLVDSTRTHLWKPLLHEAFKYGFIIMGLMIKPDNSGDIALDIEINQCFRSFYESAGFLSTNANIKIDQEDPDIFTTDICSHIKKVQEILAKIEIWNETEIADTLKHGLKEAGLKLGQVGPALRVALTGRKTAPGIFVILHALGKPLVLERLGAISRL